MAKFDRSGDKLYHQLYRVWDVILQKREKKRKELTEEELKNEIKECSFKPHTNPSEAKPKIVNH